VVEDTATTLEELTGLFGKTIAHYVDALTKDDALPKQRREREYDEKLLNAPEIVQIAKLADIYDNLSARVGTPKLRGTLENAQRLVAGFEKTIRTRRGKKALRHVRRLIAEIEEARPAPGKTVKTGAARTRNAPF
jgi:(p)ppGpp synthase/HD superfamily hydrolase